MSQPTRKEALRQRATALEQELVAIRHAIETEGDRDPVHERTDPAPNRVDVALSVISMWQNSTHPLFLYRTDTDTTEFASRDPHPKELALLSAACDYLERFFDAKETQA